MIKSVIIQVNKENKDAQNWHNTTCHAKLFSASAQPEITKQVRNDSSSVQSEHNPLNHLLT